MTELAPLLTMLFKKILNKGTISDDWKQENVLAIFKKGNQKMTS